MYHFHRAYLSTRTTFLELVSRLIARPVQWINGSQSEINELFASITLSRITELILTKFSRVQ